MTTKSRMIGYLTVWLAILLINRRVIAISFNRPRFCVNSTWDANGTTFIANALNPFGIFIDKNNTIYVNEQNSNRVTIWTENSTTPIRILNGSLNRPGTTFVANNGDIYVDNGFGGDIVIWRTNGTVTRLQLGLIENCLGLFIDNNNFLYCSNDAQNKIMKMPLNSTTYSFTTVAGTGVAGSTAQLLNHPNGIFVDENSTLYVADFSNYRIQRFILGQNHATTVVGNGASNTISLNGPTGVTLDAAGYLWIADAYNHRIVGSGPYGFLCIVGCSGSSGSTSTTLNAPRTFAFDRFGNMYVADTVNNRVQKFLLTMGLCEPTTTTTTTSSTSTTTTTTTTSSTSTTTTTTTTSSTSTTTTTTTTTTSSTSTTTTTTTATNQTCNPPKITLYPSSSMLTSPVSFRRNQDIYLTSNIQLNCNQSFQIDMHWTAKICTPNCSINFQLNPTIQTTFSELYIPSQILSYGSYEFILIVTIISNVSNISSSNSVFVQISSANITVNLMLYGTSMITRGHTQDLILDPGRYTINPDGESFNASDWQYKYYCRIYDLYNFPNVNGTLLTIDDLRTDLINPSCLNNRTNRMIANQSSIKIPARSLSSNQTYQFMVKMTNRQKPSLEAAGYLLVHIDNTYPNLIAIACVISIMCEPNMQYQRVNPTTQVALFSVCLDNCSSLINITWNIYYLINNSSLNMTPWILFDKIDLYKNLWFFGANTTNFTATNQLFQNYSQFIYWKFEVVYLFPLETSTSSINFVLNQPPRNGSCSIDPHNGTTMTSFTISCINWFDEDDIESYSVYLTQQSCIAFSYTSSFTIRLPAGIFNLSIYIQDTMNAITQFNINNSVIIIQDDATMTNLMSQITGIENQNTVNQILSLVSNELNQINTKTIQNAVAENIPLASISISSLGSTSINQMTTISTNPSALIEYNQQLNQYANLRESLLTIASNLPITNLNSVKLQATTIAQLTQATNQLTRTSATAASDKCNQLAQNLYSTATKISYEDVQNVGIQISQCTSNVLSAINGPLQQRTITLDTDSISANQLPKDYDTDLESSWSNLNLFADGDDFSQKTIEKNRNLYYQKQTASQLMSQSIETFSYLTSALNTHLNLDQNFTMNTSSMFILLKKLSFNSLSNMNIQPMTNTKIHLPSNFNQSSLGSIQFLIQPLAIADQTQSSINTNLSRLISFSLYDVNGNEIAFQTNTNQSIEILIPRDPNLILPDMNLQNVTSLNDNRLFNLHYVNLSNTKSISVHFQIQPLDLHIGYLFIYKFDSSPQLNSISNNIDGWTIFCPINLINENFYTYFINNQQTNNHQSIIFGLRELTSIEYDEICLNYSIESSLPITNQTKNFSANYKLRIYTSGCYYLDSNQQWQSNGLLVGSLTNIYQTQCFSTHLTTFAGGFLVLPEPINWNYVFSNVDFMKNKTIYITIIIISIIYILLLIYARFKDKKDQEKLGITNLSDNNKQDSYFYQILVFTGHRKGAGTNSKVQFVLSGDNDETCVRTLTNPNRKVLQRGAIDTFLMTVPKSLGTLNYIHIWHDNSGQGNLASWFLKYILVYDVQTMEKSYFICQNWFAVEKTDGRIERVLPVAGDCQKREFSYLLSKQAYHSISEGHLWFSIFARPPSSRFTCVQRCTCCFVLLFISMLLNILYYNQIEEAKTTSSSIGPFIITSQQIGIGVIIELISFVPSLLLIQFFRRIRPKQTASDQYFVYNENKQRTSLTSFPWWCIFIAYGLSLIIIIISIFFIIAKGIEFGDIKSQQWLTSLVSGLFSSIIFIQPIKIFSLTLFFICFIRKSNDDKQLSEYLKNTDQLLSTDSSSTLSTKMTRLQIDRLDKYELANARLFRLQEIQMWKLINEFLIYTFYLSMLCIIVYSSGSQQNSFLQVRHLKKFFLNLDFNRITTKHDYWIWLEKSFVNNLRAQSWYNDNPPKDLNGFLNDKSTRLIGWATMTQFRIQTRPCQIQTLVDTCTNDDNEETRSFQPGWINETINQANSSIEQAFQYHKTDYVYEFRGRLSYLRSNLSELHAFNWIDHQTRRIVIEMSLYNPNVQLFISILISTEFLSTSSIITRTQFEPISFLIFNSLSEILCIIFYYLIIIYFLIEQIRLIIKLKLQFFHQFWTYIDMGIILCSFINLGLIIWKYQQFSYINELFQQTNGYTYLNLESSVYVNNLSIYFLSFCCFFGTIKYVRLFRYHPRLSYFIQTLQQSRKDLFSFSCLFSIVFLAFVCLFYLLFNSKLLTCSSFFQTIEMLFEMTLMQFNADELQQAGSFLGPFTLSLFVFLVVFVCLSMFLTIINEHFRNVRNQIQINQTDSIWKFTYKQIRLRLGFEKSIQKLKYHDPIEQFPDKIEQLLNTLYRVTTK